MRMSGLCSEFPTAAGPASPRYLPCQYGELKLRQRAGPDSESGPDSETRQPESADSELAALKKCRQPESRSRAAREGRCTLIQIIAAPSRTIHLMMIHCGPGGPARAETGTRTQRSNFKLEAQYKLPVAWRRHRHRRAAALTDSVVSESGPLTLTLILNLKYKLIPA
jgi:hypothetical protein